MKRKKKINFQLIYKYKILNDTIEKRNILKKKN